MAYGLSDIDTTVGGESANSYPSATEAGTIFDAMPHFKDTWHGWGDERQAQELILGTKGIDRLPFEGDKNDFDQALQFPRSTQVGDEEYPETEVPWPLKEAVCEAIVLRNNMASASTGQQSRRKEEVEVKGVARVKYESERVKDQSVDGLLGGNWESIKDLLRPWLKPETTWKWSL